MYKILTMFINYYNDNGLCDYEECISIINPYISYCDGCKYNTIAKFIINYINKLKPLICINY